MTESAESNASQKEENATHKRKFVWTTSKDVRVTVFFSSFFSENMMMNPLNGIVYIVTVQRKKFTVQEPQTNTRFFLHLIPLDYFTKHS